jgi:hypothetical protein
MTTQSHLIFDKLNSIRSTTEECKNHPHFKIERFRSNIHQWLLKFRLHMFKSFLKIYPGRSTLVS